MKNHLLVIDPQNDFCDEHENGFVPALPVKGASQDMRRLGAFIEGHIKFFDDISVSLDSHSSFAIERPSFWRKADGREVDPFTFISLDDFKNGAYFLSNEALFDKVSACLETTKGIFVWPTHCVMGSVGHAVFEPLLNSFKKWESLQKSNVNFFLKGDYPLTEHFGIFQAEHVFDDIAKTQYNWELYRHLTNPKDNQIYIAGEALSHCVAASTRQFVNMLIKNKEVVKNRVYLITNCMSNVPGFEKQGEDFLQEMQDKGVTLINF